MKTKYIFLFFLCFFGFIIIRSYISSKNEDESFYNFVITKIEISPSYDMIFYNKDKKVLPHNFLIKNNEDIKIGDKIIKEKDSKILKVFRKNKDGVYEKHLEFYSNNII